MPSQIKNVFYSTAEAKSALKPGSALTIGNYDGVHLGHQEILKKLIKIAQKKNLIPTVLTFDPHPVKVLAPQISTKMINTSEQKIGLLQSLGIQVIVLQKFDEEFAKIKPEVFFEKHLLKHLNAKHIMVGYDFTFGVKRSGTIETLELLAYDKNIDVDIVPAKLSGSTLVSSSLIRNLIKEGNVKLAHKYLLRPFFIDGIVIHGHKRGTALGIHTANLSTENELLPQDGVYATLADYRGKTYKSVTNIGFNPTFHNTERSIETHIFDFDTDIYDKNLRLSFIERLRGEIKFASPEALIKQIGKDIEEAKKVLKKF